MRGSPNLNPEADRELLAIARMARAHSYSPYSHYAVGAAVRGVSGKIYAGTNIENASYSLTICAERAAIFNAISAGERDFVAIAVVTQNAAMPCGACRQVLSEFAPAIRVIVAGARGYPRSYTISELLPQSFDATKLPNKSTRR
jgi:cytidine deaminase